MKHHWVAVIILFIAFSYPAVGFAQTADAPIPEGFYLISSASGVSLYRKDYRGGSPDFVQVVDLSQGAQVIAMHGNVHEQRPGKGAYGGNDARIMAQSLQKFWRQLTDSNNDAFCVLNGQFFYMKESPTRLPFPLKVNGEIISDGYGLNDFPDNKLLLEIWPDKADITQLTYERLYGSTAPDIVAGLTQTANKRSDSYVGRTFVGVDDRNQDGSLEIILLFNSKISRQVDAASVLRSFGADQVMMLDGGGSTQLICQGESLVSSDRPIPQAIGVVASQKDYLNQNTASSPDPASGDNFSETPGENPDPIDAQISSSQTQIEAGSRPVNTEPGIPRRFVFSDVIWVPLMMTPILAVLALFVNRLRSQEF